MIRNKNRYKTAIFCRKHSLARNTILYLMATTSILNVYEPLSFQANATIFTAKINKERLVLLYTIMSSFNIAYHIS